MKYDANGRDGQPFPYLCNVIDANGQILTPVIQCDTETGWVMRYVFKDGRYQMDADGLPLVETRYFAAPLRLRRLPNMPELDSKADGYYLIPPALRPKAP